MPRWRVILRWFPAIIWMVVIFAASGDSGSFHRSSRIVEPLLKFFWPSVTPGQVHTAVVLARKSAHVGEYAVLALLLLYGIRAALGVEARRWSKRAAWLALLLSVCYAGTDELHQTRIASRQGAVADVVWDTLGASLGLGLAVLFFRRRNGHPRHATSASRARQYPLVER